MEQQDSKTYRSERFRNKFGLCFPSPISERSEVAANKLDPAANPFADIEELGWAYMILPIQAYWFPLKHLDMLEQFAQTSHETIHHYLIDTSLSYYVLALVHFQYVTLFETLYGPVKKVITIPSLNDATGWMALAQQALDKVTGPLVLVHELMATTLVQFFANQEVILTTTYLAREGHKVLDEHNLGQWTCEACGCPKASNTLFFQLCNSAFAETVQEIAKNDWLPTYAELLYDPDSHYDFGQLQARLLGVLNKIAQSTTQDHKLKLLTIALWIARYPLDIPWQFPQGFYWSSWQADLEGKAGYVSRMSNEPIARLNALLEALENAPQMASIEEWVSYARSILPDFGILRFSSEMLSGFTKRLWQEYDYPEFSRLFEVIYATPYEPTMTIDPYNLPIISDHTKWPAGIRILIALEAMRQSVVQGIGPVCFCDQKVRIDCELRLPLELLWESVVPDPDFQEEYRQNWKRPKCVLEYLGAMAKITGFESISGVYALRKQ